MGLNPETLRQLIQNCRRPSERFVGNYADGTPSHWYPHQVPNPNMPDGYYFSDQSAWEFIAEQLEAGHPYDVIPLHTPAGAVAIVMTVRIARMAQPLYIKVQVAVRNRALGRSFHSSERY